MSTPNTIPPSLVNELPARVRDVLQRRSEKEQKEFLRTYVKGRKSVAAAYLLWMLAGTHHAYLKRMENQLWLWISWLMPFGLWWLLVRATSHRDVLFYLPTLFFSLVFGFGTIWWAVDLFRIPARVREYNDTVIRSAWRWSARIGWQAELDSVWEEVAMAFEFHPKYALGRAIKEPVPSITYSLSDWDHERLGESVSLEETLQEAVVRCCEHLVSEGDWMYGLFWSVDDREGAECDKEGYQVFPHMMAEWEYWPVPVHSTDSYYQYSMLLDRRLESGIFGERMLAAVKADSRIPMLFRTTLRVDGQSV
jgi:hypothetical protein